MSQAQWMEEAFALAEEAGREGEIPVGAVVVDRDGNIIGRGRNRRESGDPLGHAELIAIAEAAKAIGGWRLEGATMVVTLEPCAMCAGAIVLARVPRVVYAADDPKAGAAGSVLNVLAEPRLNHRPAVAGGLLAQDAAELLRAFFASKR
jgi:tRNA(adenine34) deaminase